MRSFDMDIFILHTGAPWPLCVLSMAISWLSWGEQVHSILSQYQAEYPAILDIATSLSLNKLFGRLCVTGSKQTPAMVAGITDHCWTIRQLLSFHVPPPRWIPSKQHGRPSCALKCLIERWCL